MTTNTLTSLAILKVNIDQGRDYFEYLKPFVLQVLFHHNDGPITSKGVCQSIRDDFGLEIPEHIVGIVLRRIAKRNFIKRDSGIYRKSGNVPDPQIESKQAEARRHIQAVVNELLAFSKETAKPLCNEEAAVEAICTFLSNFNIQCLRSYLRGTAIPDLNGTHPSRIVLVSHYVQHLQATSPERFDSFLILVQGHMLANALMCPDLQSSNSNYRNVTFYLDTPLLVSSLGSHGEAKQAAVKELIGLVTNLKGRVAAFSHSRDELRSVLYSAASHLYDLDPRGVIVYEARKRSLTKSDILLLAESLNEELAKSGIEIAITPKYIEKFQIDETMFEYVLDEEVQYHNPRAREYDINSVRSIYALRADAPVSNLEDSHAVLVTSNRGFARAAWDFGQQHMSSRNVSSVIHEFTLANIAWLKAPMGAPSIPMTQLLAFSYAALEPSKELLGKYLKEIERLQQRGSITVRDHELLRSSPLVHRELMHLTLGDDSALTEETVTETLERVSNEIKKEEANKLAAEQKEHQRTREELTISYNRYSKLKKNVYWQCSRRAEIYANILAVLIGLLMVGDIAASVIVSLTVSSIAGIIAVPFIVMVGALTLLNRWFGLTLKGIRKQVRDWILRKLLKRKEKSIGVDFSSPSSA